LGLSQVKSENTLIETKYNSLTEASSNLPGTTITKICSVLQGRRKTHKGYTFKYQEINEYMEDEIWVCLINPLFKGIEVSNFGRVKGKKGIITKGNSHGGYKRLSVSQDNNGKQVFVHQLVCEAFRDTTNNHASNLRWASKYEQRLNTKNINKIQVFDENNNIVATYNTITEAKLNMNIHRNTIKNCCLTGRKYKNYTFMFVKEPNVDI
jgi:hypothetical protein